MENVDLIESSRLKAQQHLDSTKTQAERNKLGQFATPAPLAKELLEYARKTLPSNLNIRFLDPAFGTGSFYSALLKTFPRSRIANAAGYEIDKHFAGSAAELWGGQLLQLDNADFTRQSAPSSDNQRANLLICNPPYVRHHHLSLDDKNRLRIAARRSAGVSLSGLSGLYCYFMCIAHSWLAEDALAGWLIPSEFMDVNYGGAIKEYLLNQVTLLRIHRFNPAEVQFDDALVSSAIVWFKKTASRPDHFVDFTFGGTLTKPSMSRRIPARDLPEASKWTKFPQSAVSPKRVQTEIKLSDLFTIKRGIATGANKFFILTPERIAELQLPKSFLIPILPSPRYLSSDEVLADHHGDPLVKRKQYLLACKLPEPEVEAKYPSLWSYLQFGEEQGIHEKYLSQHRCPWYSQEERLPPLFLCTYISRKSKATGETFRFILNHSKAIAANVYLLLYPKKPLGDAIRAQPELVKSLWQALRAITSEALTGEGRVYGGGLYKIEPRELGNVSAQGIISTLPTLWVEADQQPSLW
ncbi:MAG: Eco57I restriction-modification methylase domain-containing protein [Acidobacteriota bacterium]|nr:Eco57I restriction-modification methylase domain-containing protein [Acidobacteriota bacterium]